MVILVREISQSGWFGFDPETVTNRTNKFTDVGYEMLGDDAGSAGLADHDPLFDQEMEQPMLRKISCGHPSRVMINL